MGHGIGFQDQGAPWGVERIGKSGLPSGVYNTYHIPFGKSVRVTAMPLNPSRLHRIITDARRSV